MGIVQVLACLVAGGCGAAIVSWIGRRRRRQESAAAPTIKTQAPPEFLPEHAAASVQYPPCVWCGRGREEVEREMQQKKGGNDGA
jgi:hypothetical protein